jgi:hypothetical protein
MFYSKDIPLVNVTSILQNAQYYRDTATYTEAEMHGVHLALPDIVLEDFVSIALAFLFGQN